MLSYAEDPIAVCVIGMSRSGTSLTARILGLLGVYLGPEEELLGGELTQLADDPEARARARAANPHGFFEHYRLMRLNERILRALGGSWRDPPELPPGWEADAALAGERDEARALVAETFAGRELWGWKDPRTSLTLALWRQLVPGLRCVVCLRNPVDVAASLERRDGMPVAEGMALWQRYVASALVASAGLPRLLVSYDEYFDDPAAVVGRLARFAGVDPPAARGEVDRRVHEAIDERLRHHRTPPGTAIADPRVPRDVAALDATAELLRVAAPVRRDGESARLHALVDAYAERLLDETRPATARG